jgi:PAS domain S-box-containing protein
VTKELRILILEDRPADAELTIRELRKKEIPFAAECVATEAAFLAQLRDFKPQLILADYSLPGYDGLSALAEAQKQCPETPFIFVSGSLGEEKAIETLHRGATDYVLKQRLARLGPAVRRALHEREEIRKGRQAEERVRELNLVLRATGAINALMVRERDPQRLLAEACKILVETRGYQLAWIGRVEAGSKRVVPAASAGKDVDYLDAVTITWDEAPTGLGPIGTAIRTGQPVASQDIAADPRLAPWMEKAKVRGFAAVAAMPMVRGSRVLGVVAVYSGRTGAFNAEELELLRELASDLAFALQSIEHEQERTLAEESLRENERRYRLLFNSGYDAVFVHQGGSAGNPPGKFIEVNDIACQRLGYTREELLQMTPLDISAPETLSDIPGIRARLTAEKSAISEGVHLTKAGRRIPVEISTHVFELNGKPTRLSTVRDITERKRAEQRIAAFANLGRRLNAAKTAREAAGIIVEVADELLGWDACVFDLYSAAENRMSHLLTMDIIAGRRAECQPQRLHRTPTELASRALEKGGQLILRDDPGTQQPMGLPFGDKSRTAASLMFVPVRHGTEVIGILSIQSYTPKAYDAGSLETLQALADHGGGALERLRAQDALNESEATFRSVWERSVDGMRLTDKDGCIVAVNEAFCRLVKLPREKLEGQVLSVAYKGHGPTDGIELYQKRFADGEVVPRLATRTQLRNGEETDLDISSSFIELGQRGKMLLSIFRDVSERKRAELRITAFSSLGQKLSAAKTSREAAKTIFEAAGQMLGWDACSLSLYSSTEELMHHVMTCDTVDGRRVESQGPYDHSPPSPLARRVIEEGGQLILKDKPDQMAPDGVPFGNRSQPSASILFVPIREGSNVIGILSIHSYTPKAYDRHNLATLQSLADHCGGALDRIRTQEELLREQEFTRALLDNIADGVVACDARGALALFNRTVREWHGMETLTAPPEAWASQLSLHGPDGATPLPPEEVPLLRAFHGETLRDVKLTIVAQGQPPRHILASGSPFFDAQHNLLGAVAVLHDISRRRQAELRIAAFSNLGQKLSAAKAAREAAEIIADAADRLLGWDACTLDLYSPETDSLHYVLNRDTINGQHVDFPPTCPAGPPSPRERQTIEAGGQLILKEDALVMLPETKPFGDAARPSASIMLVCARAGAKIVGLLSLHSYTPKAYDQNSLDTLQALADHCGGALDRITTEETLRTAQQQLRQSQKMEAIGQLAGGVAHDFNNMLAVIRGNAELLLLEPTRYTVETIECLKQVVAASERAANLTRQLLAFSRKQVMQSRPLVLNDVIADLTKMLRRIIGEHLDLQCRYAAHLPFIQADAGMIEQVLVNLAVNARDAMPNGGQLLITTAPVTFDEAPASAHPEARAGEFVCLAVADAGTGIAPENLPRIFEPFFTTKEVGKGTGLGLATVYGIVKQHQGWIEVSSQLGAGTTFTIFLPAIATPANSTATPQAAASLPGGTETILLVEDEYAVRMVTRRVLESHGYKVYEATTAREALDLWRSRAAEIALVLTDMVMPEGVTGRDLAEQLRAQSPALKIIFMSGYSADVIGKGTEFFRQTGSHFLQKPASTRALLETVRRSLDGK